MPTLGSPLDRPCRLPVRLMVREISEEDARSALGAGGSAVDYANLGSLEVLADGCPRGALADGTAVEREADLSGHPALMSPRTARDRL
jgi:hypothetical protein